MPAVTATVVAVASVAAAGATAYGSYSQSQASRKAAEAQGEAARLQAEQNQREIQAQQRQEELRRRAMELEASRAQRELTRVQQRSRAYALATANSQGASLGSGLLGAYGQIAGQTGSNMLGLGQNLEMGRTSFGINADLSNSRIAYAQQAGAIQQQIAGYQGQAATAAGISSLGGAFMSALPTFGSFARGFGGNRPSFATGGGSTYGGFISGLGRGPIY